MSGKAGGKFMEGQVCLFSSNRQWDCSNRPSVSPNHARPGTSRTWRTCWNSQAWYYSKNVGRWLIQYGCVRYSSVCPHALVLINTHSGWITLSVGIDGYILLFLIFSSVPLMYNACSFLLLFFYTLISLQFLTSTTAKFKKKKLYKVFFLMNQHQLGLI